MQSLVAFGWINGDEIFWMYASDNMAIYAIEMTMVEASSNLVALQQGSSKLLRNYLERIMLSPHVGLNKVQSIQVS